MAAFGPIISAHAMRGDEAMAGSGVAYGGSSGGFRFWGGARAAESEANRLFDACMEARGWRSAE